MFLSVLIILILFFGYPIFHFIIVDIIYFQFIPYKAYNIIKSIMDLSKKYIKIVSYLFFVLLFVAIMCLQKETHLPIFDLKNKNLIEILGFSLALLSLYGIYIGFLQYLTGHNDGNLFLGKSKLNFLINSSIWYRITQSSFFFTTLLFETFIPGLIKLDIKLPGLDLNQTLLELSYIWQTTVFILLFLYILLLRMSLEIISITLLMKTGSDSGMQYIIKKEIKDTYERVFWKIYNNQIDYQNLFEDMLSIDLKKLASKDIDEYIVTSFQGIKEEFTFKNRKNFWKKERIENLARFYIFHLQKKWSFLTSQINNISYPVWQNLVIDDISNINYFENTLDIRLSIQEIYSNKFVTEFLFDQLLKKYPSNLQEIIKNTEKTTNDISFIKGSKSYKFKIELEKYKWKEIFETYYTERSNVILPSRKKKTYKRTNKSEKIMIEARDLYNSDLSSQACFEFLTGYFGKITENIQSNEYLKSLIFSMNNEYLISFILYQMLYTDGTNWEKNFKFFDRTLKSILNFCEEEEFKYYFNFVKKTLLHTSISHRISENFFDYLWNTKNKRIDDLKDWYSKFNQRHISTPFRLLYIQSIFTSPYENRYTPRIQFQSICTTEDYDLAVCICREFFQLLENHPKLKENNYFCLIVKELLTLPNFDFEKLLESLKLKSLLYFEFIMKYKISYKKRLDYQEIMFKQIEVNYNNEIFYLFRSDALLQFFVIKSIQQEYQPYFNLVEFSKTLKRDISNFLSKEDLNIHEYIEIIYEELKGEEIKISKIEKVLIIDKLQSLMQNPSLY